MISFAEWYAAQYDGWKANHQAHLELAWQRLESRGIPNDIIVDTFNIIADAIRDQYGD